MALVLTLCDGFEGALLVLVAMQLGSRVDRRTGLVWIAVQTVLLCAAITYHWSLRPALMLAVPRPPLLCSPPLRRPPLGRLALRRRLRLRLTLLRHAALLANE